MHTSIFLSIAGFIIVLMLGIIGYFVNRLVTAVDKLEMTISSLNSLVLVQEEKLRQMGERHKVIDRRLEKHASRIESAEKDIQSLRTS